MHAIERTMTGLRARGRCVAPLLVLLAALMAAMAPAAAASSRGRVDAFLAHHWPRGASGTVLVARGDRAIACRGLGWADRARRVRASCDTAYDLMSMTKQFTAAGILELQAMGRLDVSDPISRFVDGVPDDKRAITIAQLLTHTSGLRAALGGDYEPLSRDQMLAEAMRSRLLSAPGSAYHYSNVGYSILAAIIERASGTTYERFLARHLFRPAGMRHTGYVLPHWGRGQVAVEIDRHGRAHGRPLDHPWAADGPYWNLRGNGGMLSTARDMLRWHRALLGDTVLSAETKRELFAPRMQIAPGDSVAYGWDIFTSPLGPVAAHNGGNGWSFGVLARVLDDGTFVFWVSNHARQAGRWNLERRETRLTFGLAVRATRDPGTRR
jgi:CubicO group peptidase (beta-lactamase class C family)